MKPKNIRCITVDADKCTGCRSCELACSAFHAVPRYSSINPARSRIRVFVDETGDVYIPVRGGDDARAECSGRNRYTIDTKEYDECVFCRAPCPSRDWFREPDSGLPLTCDMCESDPPLAEPMCVQACKFEALTYEERQAETEAPPWSQGGIEDGLTALIDRHGLQKTLDAVARMLTKRSG